MAPDFKPDRIMQTLAKHGVNCIFIGGMAAFLQGSPIPTEDVDIVPEVNRDNLTRLSRALKALDAKVRADGTEPLPFGHDADSLAAGNIWNLTTRYGDLDITFTPSGTRGYADLKRDAIEVSIHGTTVKLAALVDIVRSKEAAGRDKDRRALPILRELVDRQLRERAGRPRRG
ncbi:MAG TPA: hypothetical protein VFJ17_06265 [Mycobacteriales bacterium]|nr:hypothetical protein [Mycobacteriales bacterium]